MNRVVKVVSLATAMACASMGALNSAHAQNNGDPLSLKIANAISPDRFFIRAGVIGVKVKTKSGSTYDVTGPVITKEELENLFITPEAQSVITIPTGVSATQAQAGSALRGSLGAGLVVSLMERSDAIPDQLGTPAGIKAIAKESAGTAGLSLGYYLSDDYTWLVEAYVLAAPLKTSVMATGAGSFVYDEDLGAVFRPFGLQGQKIISTKLLPPTVMLGKYWGDKSAKFRPYTGLLAMYAIFYDTKASDALNSYVGGSNPGDTTVSLKNTFGVGPMLGFKYQFAESWHASFNVGSVKLKTVGTITTRNTLPTGATGAIRDYGTATAADANDLTGSISNAIASGEFNYQEPDGGGQLRFKEIVNANGGLVRLISKGVAAGRGQENLGTYVRKADSTLTNTIFMLSVGRSF